MIEQRLNIAFRHFGQLLGAEPHQPHRSAVAVLGIGRARLVKRGNRGVPLPKLFADFAEREPGGGKLRHELYGLLKEIGGGRQVALQLQIAGEFEAAVGNQIAR